MPKTSPPSRRPYLWAPERRRQLLDAAVRLIGRDGFARLSMVALAAEAGVSRQLVYEHFPDLPSLVAAILLDRVGELDQAVAAALERADASPPETAVAAARGLLSLPAQDRHVIRVLLAHAAIPGHELSAIAQALRTRSIARWTPILQAGDDPGSRARTWATVAAVFALGDLVDSGEITVEDAIAELPRLLRGTDLPRPAG
jgi:AcrR family transcriptional regulator